MRLYTVHLRRHGLDPELRLALVKEGFSWPAFLFSFAWALWHRMWLVASILAAASLVLGLAMALLGLDPVSEGAVSAGIAVVIGFVANDLRRWSMSRAGFVHVAVVGGEERDAAERRFLDNAPELAAELQR